MGGNGRADPGAGEDTHVTLRSVVTGRPSEHRKGGCVIVGVRSGIGKSAKGSGALLSYFFPFAQCSFAALLPWTCLVFVEPAPLFEKASSRIIQGALRAARGLGITSRSACCSGGVPAGASQTHLPGLASLVIVALNPAPPLPGPAPAHVPRLPATPRHAAPQVIRQQEGEREAPHSARMPACQLGRGGQQAQELDRQASL